MSPGPIFMLDFGSQMKTREGAGLTGAHANTWDIAMARRNPTAEGVISA